MQAPLRRSHVAILNAAGRTVALGLGMRVVDFEMMASQFDSASQYLAVTLVPRPSLSVPGEHAAAICLDCSHRMCATLLAGRTAPAALVLAGGPEHIFEYSACNAIAFVMKSRHSCLFSCCYLDSCCHTASVELMQAGPQWLCTRRRTGRVASLFTRLSLCDYPGCVECSTLSACCRFPASQEYQACTPKCVCVVSSECCCSVT